VRSSPSRTILRDEPGGLLRETAAPSSALFASDEISLPLSSARLLRGSGVHVLASDQGRSYRSNYLGEITAQRLDANIGESIFEGFARKSWNGTKPPALDAAASSSAA